MTRQIDVTTTSEVLSVLVQRVESGDEIVLTRGGRPVARIIPEAFEEKVSSELTPEQQAAAAEAIASIRARAERLHLGAFDPEQFRRDRDEGRL